VPLPEADLGRPAGEFVEGIGSSFHQTHERLYGYSLPQAAWEVAAVRVSGEELPAGEGGVRVSPEPAVATLDEALGTEGPFLVRLPYTSVLVPAGFSLCPAEPGLIRMRAIPGPAIAAPAGA
jgi:hypothetical protein